jgi:hypothetical protein
MMDESGKSSWITLDWMVEIGGLKLTSLLSYLGFSLVCTAKNHKESVVVKLLAESGFIRVVGGHSCEYH